jgi:hypothetical protein
MLLPQVGHAIKSNFPVPSGHSIAKQNSHDIAALSLWLVGGIARKGNANRRKTMTTQTEKPAETSSIAFIGWTVEKRNGKTYWTRVGVAFKPHKDGEGFTTSFAAGIAVSGEVVWRKPKSQEDEQPAPVSDDDIPF